MPAQNIDLVKKSVRTDRSVDDISIKNSFIHLDQNTRINFNEYVNSTQSDQPHVIINVVGNANIFEYFDRDYIAMARKFPSCKIVGFNFRNVQLSEGVVTSPNDWLNDIKAVVDHYCGKGILAENILILGNSLGAANATLGAAKLHQLNLKVKHINVRSFSDLSAEIVQAILPSISSLFEYSWIKFGSLKLTQGTLALLFGNMYPLLAYISLPDDAKDYISAIDDDVITKGVRMHDGLKEINRQKKQAIKNELKTPDISAERIAYLEVELLNIKDSKLRCSSDAQNGFNAHNDDLQYLKTAHKQRTITGDLVLENKIKRLLKL